MSELATVELLELPVPLWAASTQGSRELFREFELIAAGGSDSHPLPAELTSLVAALTSDDEGVSTAQEEELEAAHAAGQQVVERLVFQIPPQAAGACQVLGDMMDQADEYCRQGTHLLTLAAEPEVVAFRRWYLVEFIRQIDGLPPVPWPQYDGYWPTS